MGDFYTYLIASLPMLHFGMKPPLSFERFLEMCHRFIPEKDFFLLNHLPQPEQYADRKEWPAVIRRWIAFDVALRNELVRLRATRQHLEPAPYLHRDASVDSSITPAVMAAGMQPSILEAERILDEARWRFLETLATGHHFDRDVLVTYAYQLRMLRRWEAIRQADADHLLDQAFPPPRHT
jgi:hypothetical protein